jgi:hypothetical protein
MHPEVASDLAAVYRVAHAHRIETGGALRYGRREEGREGGRAGGKTH